MGYRLMEIARERAGIDMRRERDAQIILRAANTTSDFPLLLEAAANKCCWRATRPRCRPISAIAAAT
jgi:hypothetical protein